MKLARLFLLACCPALLVLFNITFAEGAENKLVVTEMTVTTKIVRGNPIDSVHRISSTSVKALYCFTRIDSASDRETFIRHIWYRDNEKMGEYKLPVKDKKWRTYSKKAIEKGWSGDWRIDALDSEGHILKSVKFRMN